MSTIPHQFHNDRHALLDVITLVSYLRTSIASAILSDRCPSGFDLECLTTLQSALGAEYERKYCTQLRKQDAELASVADEETNGVT